MIKMIKTNRISVLWLAAALFCVGLTLGVAGQDRSDDTVFADFLASYDEAFNAKDLDKLATFYHPEVTISKAVGSTVDGRIIGIIIWGLSSRVSKA